MHLFCFIEAPFLLISNSEARMPVAFLPYGQPIKHLCDLGHISFDDVEWPLDDRPEGNCLGDLQPEDHVIVVASSRVLTLRKRTLDCPVSVLLCEPPAIQKRLYPAIASLRHRFCYMLTHNTRLLQKVPNARFVAHGGSMIGSCDQPRTQKTQRVSLIASPKKSTIGHRLRHDIVDWAKQHANDLTALGRGYEPLEEKADGHNPFYFSVVIENSREPGYFTEKLIDSFLCHSLPIYWGAPDIAHFFEPLGMICCSSAEEVKAAIQTLTIDDYVARKEALLKNRELAMRYTDFFGRAAQLVADLDQAGHASGRLDRVSLDMKAA